MLWPRSSLQLFQSYFSFHPISKARASVQKFYNLVICRISGSLCQSHWSVTTSSTSNSQGGRIQLHSSLKTKSTVSLIQWDLQQFIISHREGQFPHPKNEHHWAGLADTVKSPPPASPLWLFAYRIMTLFGDTVCPTLRSKPCFV